MANKVRLIDMNTLWQCETCFHHYPNGCDTYCDHGESYRPAADQLTVIDPESLRPKGRWIDTGDTFEDEYCRYNYFECSVCECEIAGRYGLYRYCPNCGAKMEG